eukprot:3849473-Pleurochrysis_carterae.AAC.1
MQQCPCCQWANLEPTSASSPHPVQSSPPSISIVDAKLSKQYSFSNCLYGRCAQSGACAGASSSSSRAHLCHLDPLLGRGAQQRGTERPRRRHAVRAAVRAAVFAAVFAALHGRVRG